MRNTFLFFGFCLFGLDAVAEHRAETPIFEITDHERGLAIKTVHPEWSIQCSKFGLKLLYSPGLHRIEWDTESIRKPLVDYVAEQRAHAEKNDKAEMSERELRLKVGDEEAQGFSFVVKESREVFLKTWLDVHERRYELEIQVEEEAYDKVMEQARQMLAAVIFIEPKNGK